MVHFAADPVTIVAKVASTQMGVSIRLGGVNNWADYLDREVENNDLDETERTEFLARFDGYQMEWAFDTTAITRTAENAIDAACISSNYGGGGYCVGLKFTGSTLPFTPGLWATWTHIHQFNEFVSNSELGGEDDVTNWHTDETGFLTTWTTYRWQPKYEFIVDHYDNEFRFSPETNDVYAWAYSSTDGTTFALAA